MNLSYPILWIDDQKTSVEGYAENIEEYLDDLGYEPDIQIKSPIENIDEMLSDPRWNLIAVDYQLANDLTGEKLINEIRKSQYTEIVFYSSDPDLVEGAIKEKALEGVYWASREDEFEEKIKKIIDVTLKKIMDVNTMRGIVMAEVAEIDHQMEDIIRLHHDNINEKDQTELQQKIIERVEDLIKSKTKTITKLKEVCSLDGCLDFRVIDSDKRLRTVEGICIKAIKAAKLDDCRKVFADRNLLAHGRTFFNGNEEVVKSGDKEFSLTSAIELRKALKEQRKHFHHLHTVLGLHHKKK